MKERIIKCYKWNPNKNTYNSIESVSHIIDRMGWIIRQDCKYWKRKLEDERHKA